MNIDLLRIVSAIMMTVGAIVVYITSRYQKPAALRNAYTGFCICIFIAACFEGSLPVQRALPELVQYMLSIVFALASIGVLVFGLRVWSASRRAKPSSLTEVSTDATIDS
jgi:hypothetical protein